MAKNNAGKKTLPTDAGEKITSYAYKPKLIGPVIAEIMERKQIDIKTIASKMDVTEHTVRNWLTYEYLSVDIMMQLSELLDQDLLLEYRSNVKPLPNPLQEELDKKNGYLKEMEEIENENARLKTITIRQDAE